MDVHAFTPGELTGHARAAGLDDVRVRGEELAASLFGWANRTLEGTAEPTEVPWAWRVYAYRGYLLLQRLDRSLLEPRLTAGAVLQPARVRAGAGLGEQGQRGRCRQDCQGPIRRFDAERGLGW